MSDGRSKDPFQPQPADVSRPLDQADDDVWPSPSHVVAPRWQLQTQEERADQQNALNVMRKARIGRVMWRVLILFPFAEAKLARIERTYTPTMAPDRDIGVPSDDDDDDDMANTQEEQEGLSLLWQQRYAPDDLDEALRHGKSEQQYTRWSPWSICCCAN
ncbi:hypothetical protein BC940DRAFT_296493 [Gongronella butleri]|nr:hypothetical protein BC940DRAFT_296493 [Gongronella butleri]